MGKKQLTTEQKRLETDLWLIALITFAVFGCYAVMGNSLMSFVKDEDVPVMLRLFANAVVQFGVAGLGITVVCMMRKESFVQFGLKKDKLVNAIIGTALCFVPVICYILVSGQYRGYQPFHIMIAADVLAGGLPAALCGMAVIAIVWGFFEGFNYAVVCEKINRRYPPKSFWLDYGARSCAVICILFHPVSLSFWGVVDIITTFIAIYGMLLVKKKTGNAWGCVFAFCFIWNAI